MKPNLSTPNAELPALVEKTQYRIDLCRDAIKMLTGAAPDSLTFTFSMKDKPVLQFDIASDGEMDMCLSYFVYWLQYFQRRMNDINAAIRNS